MPDYEILFTVEEERECGYRKPGADGVGIYLVGDMLLGGGYESCERLPYPLVTCPCCGGGIKFSRSFTWINPIKLFSDLNHCTHANDGHHHNACPMCNPEMVGTQAGLLWVGQQHYTPEAFTLEALRLGVSRKLPSIPRGFEIGRHIIYMAHIAACTDVNVEGEIVRSPGVFFVFKPRHVDLVVSVDRVEDLPERAKNLKDSLGDNARIIRVLNAASAPGLEMIADSEEDEE